MASCSVSSTSVLTVLMLILFFGICFSIGFGLFRFLYNRKDGNPE